MSYQLLIEANRLSNLGYDIGLTKSKDLVGKYHEGTKPDSSWDGISLILTEIVCVDFDTHLTMDAGWGNDLPPSWKEKTPRGYHLFYFLPTSSFQRISKIKWKPHIDLLTQGKKIKYGSKQFESHALLYPSNGYSRVYPDIPPSKHLLTLAPKWLQKELF